MSTSGTQNYTQTLTEIINDAFQLIGVYGIGRTISSEDFTFAKSLLNKMVKAWAVKGLHLWEKTEGILFITPNTATYSLGNATTDANVTTLNNAIITQLNGNIATSTSALTVASTTGMTIGDHIGVVLSDKTIHWTTIATIPSSTTLTLTLATTGAASDDTYVYTYTNKIYKPLRILTAYRRTGIDLGSTSTQSDLPLASVSYQDYFDLPTKTSNSVPNQFYYKPQLSNGTLYLFPRPTDGAERIVFTYERMIEDLTNVSDNFDIPNEWLEVLTYQLAIRLGPPFGKSQRTMQTLLPIASIMLEDLLAWDSETTELRAEPDMGYN